MKTITMDFSEYETEIKDSYNKGRSELLSRIDRMLKVMHNTTVEELEQKYDDYEHAKAGSELRAAMASGKLL